jgi:hypothetical protein
MASNSNMLANTSSFLGGCWHGVGAGCGWVLLNLLWVGMLGIALWYGYTSYNLVSTGATVSAIVTENRAVSDEDGTSYKPVFSYVVDDRTYTYESINSSDPPAYRVGDRVTLRYDRANPALARVDNIWELWLLPGILGPVALIMALLVNGGYFLAWRRGTLFEGNNSSD